MCIIHYIPINGPIPSDEYLNNSWENNDDGAGMMFVYDGKVQIYKSMNKREFIDMVKEVHKNLIEETPLICHYRVGTCGERSIYNVHPFEIFKDKLAYCHNGQIYRMQYGSKESDSHEFANQLRELPEHFLNNEAINLLISNFIDKDKLVFLNNKKETYIFYEDLGIWEDGIWYSNNTMKVIKYPYYIEEYNIVENRNKCEWCVEYSDELYEGKFEIEDDYWHFRCCKECIKMFIREEDDSIFIKINEKWVNIKNIEENIF